jgi:hypothetical protein
MDIAVWLSSPVEWLLGSAGIRPAKQYRLPALPDDSRSQLHHERLLAQLRLDRLKLAARRPL